MQEMCIRDSYEQARVAIAPLLAAHPELRSPSTNTDVSSRPEREPGSPASALARWGGEARSGETPVFSDRLIFLLALAVMDEHLGDTALAIDDLQTAAALTPDAAQRPSLSLRITALQSRLDLQQQNAARRPIIQSKMCIRDSSPAGCRSLDSRRPARRPERQRGRMAA